MERIINILKKKSAVYDTCLVSRCLKNILSIVKSHFENDSKKPRASFFKFRLECVNVDL